MALRLMTAIAGGRALRSLGCVLLLVGTFTIGPERTPAQESDEAYSATVKVDATADSAAAAREMARIDGQRRALAAVIERLSGSSESANPPKLDDKTITDMVASFEVANERMSAVRYVADYTFHFRPSKVRRLARVAEAPPAEGAAKGTGEGGTKPVVERTNRPLVVLPVYRDGKTLVLWDDPNEWRVAWSQRPAEGGSSRLVLPLGDAGDLAAIDAETAESGKPDALSAIVQRNRGSEAVVALAAARRQGGKLAGLDVSIKRYRAGRLVDTQGSSFEANPGESEADLLKRAVECDRLRHRERRQTERRPVSRSAGEPCGHGAHQQSRRMGAAPEPPRLGRRDPQDRPVVAQPPGGENRGEVRRHPGSTQIEPC